MPGRSLPLGAFALVIPAIAASQTGPVSLAPINVTADREPEAAGETLASVTVITREDIERSQPVSVLDLLRTQAGIDVSRTGGLGSLSSVFMRGTESDHVLVLIDGVRASSATAAAFAFEQLNPAQIERVEIVRGPRSSLYGSDAIGGVIQIFTRKVHGPSAAVEAGSYDTYRGEAGYGGGDDGVRFSVNGAYVNSDGFSATNPNVAFGFDPDDDGYKESSVTANLDAKLSKRAAISLRGWHSDGEVQFDRGVTDTQNDTADLSLSFKSLPKWRHQLNVGYALDQEATKGEFTSDISTHRISANWQNNIAFGHSRRMIAGVDYYRDNGESVGDFPFDESINDVGAYGNLRLSLGAYNLQLGIRYDEHSEFGGHATGQIALGRQLTQGTRAFVAFGTAFKAPTLNDLFFPGSGNPDLDPESSRTTEVGLSYQNQKETLRASGNAFYTEVDDLIETVFVGPGQFDFRNRNVAQATIKGLELNLDWNFATNWLGTASFTLQDAHNDTDDTDLLRRPDKKLALGLTRVFKQGASITAEGLLISPRTDTSGLDTVELPGYGLVNLSLQYPLLKTVFFEARVENLLDKEYELASGFNTPGLSGYLGLRYAPAGQ